MNVNYAKLYFIHCSRLSIHLMQVIVTLAVTKTAKRKSLVTYANVSPAWCDVALLTDVDEETSSEAMMVVPTAQRDGPISTTAYAS